MPSQTHAVHLYLPDGLADWEPGYAIAGINNPMWQVEPGRYQVQTVGASSEPVRTVGGVTILPDTTLEALDPARSAMLILPGSYAFEEGGHLEALAKAQAFLAAGVPVAAICGATFGLASVGVLDDKRHTSSALIYLQQCPSYRGEGLYQDEPAVTDGDLITASPTAPVDFAYHIFKKLGIYADDTLEAWFRLFKHGDASAFFALEQAAA
ncbi:MAG: DJ-1/PfpI family protein [Thermomicrobiales bacterium]